MQDDIYSLERSKADNIFLKLGDKILTIHLFGLKQYKEFQRANERLLQIQDKIEKIQETDTATDTENIEFLEQGIAYLMSVVLGEDNTREIEKFFDGNFDEMLMILIPFIEKVFMPKLDKQIKEQSKEKAKEYVELLGISDSN